MVKLRSFNFLFSDHFPNILGGEVCVCYAYELFIDWFLSPRFPVDNTTTKNTILIYFFHLLIYIIAKLPPFLFSNFSSGSWPAESLMRCRSQSGSVRGWLLVYLLSNHNNKSSTAGMFNGIFLSRMYTQIQQFIVHSFFHEQAVNP